MTKKEHWLTEDFPAFLREHAAMPFAWGSNDCALFAADAIVAITGVDIAAEFRGYDSKIGALRSIHAVTGGGTVADAIEYCAERFGLVEHQYPLMAKRGDLALLKNPDGDLIAGVVDLDGRKVVSPGEAGLLGFSISTIVRAWSLGDGHEWTRPSWKAEEKG